MGVPWVIGVSCRIEGKDEKRDLGLCVVVRDPRPTDILLALDAPHNATHIFSCCYNLVLDEDMAGTLQPLLCMRDRGGAIVPQVVASRKSSRDAEV